MADSYRAIYQLLGAKEHDDFIFTASGAEAVSQAILSTYMQVTVPTLKNHYISSHIDEAPALMSIARLEQLGCKGTLVSPNKQGQITAEIIGEEISPRTALVSLSWANGLTGVIHPIADIAKLCQQRSIALHVDATHVLGKLFFDLDDIGAQFISFNGDHLHAPKGSGGLWVRSGAGCASLIAGGMEQGGLRGGNLNVAALAALGHAATEALECRDLVCTEVARLRDNLETGIAAAFPEAVPLYRNQERLPHCTAIAFPGISNEALLYALNRKGVYGCIGGGSFQQISLLLTASGIDLELAQSAVSFSLSRETTEDEIDRAIEIIAGAAKSLRRLSAHCQGI
jgi:cysteine desulfurase